jgi:hypothetical protein
MPLMQSNRLGFTFGLAALCLGGVTLCAQEVPPAPDNAPGVAPNMARSGGDNRGGGERMGERRGRGNFDPAEFQQRMLEHVRNRLGFTNDAEWNAVQPLVQKVLDARRDSGFGGMPPMMMMRGRQNGPNAGAENAANPRRNFFAQSNPDAEALQKALDDNAPAATVQAALARYRAANKEKQAKLEAAQENLRKVLSAKQEAQAVMLGLLN